MSRSNYVLLTVMFLAWLGMSSYFPYIVPIINYKFAMSAASIGILMALSVIIGNVFSLLFALRLKQGRERFLFFVSFLCYLVAVLGMVFEAPATEKYLKFIWIGGFVALYRFASGIYFSSSRALQISSLKDDKERLSLFSLIKLVNSIAAGLGPLVGQFAIKRGGYDGLMILSASFFGLALILLTFRTVSTRTTKVNSTNLPETAADSRGRRFYFICMGATFHFIFEAQLYAYMTMKLIQWGRPDLIPVAFATNAIALITIGLLATRYARNLKGSLTLVILGSAFSLFSIILMDYGTSFWLVVLIGILFSIGEYITPQLALDLVTTSGSGQLSDIGIFNFFTSAIGLSLGFFVGGVLADLKSSYTVHGAWILVFAMVAVTIGQANKSRGENAKVSA